MFSYQHQSCKSTGIELTIGQTPTSLECDGCHHSATFHELQETARDAEGLREAKAEAKAEAEAKESASVRGMFKQAVRRRASRIFGKKP